nr:metallopeptidase family protein [Protofrankia symbiont of Coriaria ruscifolia]
MPIGGFGFDGRFTDVVEVSRDRFEALVADALDSLPPELGRQMCNIAILVEDEPPLPGLLGLYEGVPLPERGDRYSGVLPDRITIYRKSICDMGETEAQVVEQVRVTVIHEVAHHFGIDDRRLAELGWE